MKIENAKVYDLQESLIASGYPMRTSIPESKTVFDSDIRRAKKLVTATCDGNGAHAQFLTGIRVAFDLTFTNKAWVEAERYRFFEFVSSQSTMHRITRFNLEDQYNEYVDPIIVKRMKELVDYYNSIPEKDTEQRKEAYLKVLYSNPAGFQLTARITTNYRCLRNIWIQRHDHRLPEWREFCKWIETLPYADQLILAGVKDNDN